MLNVLNLTYFFCSEVNDSYNLMIYKSDNFNVLQPCSVLF